MRVTEIADAQSFLRSTSDLLMREEVANNLLLSSSLTLARSSSGRLPNLSYFQVAREKVLEFAALNVSGRRLLLSTGTVDAAHALGREFRSRSLPLKCIFGPTALADAFSSGLVAEGSKPLQIKHDLLQLTAGATTLEGSDNPSGLWRTGKSKDYEMLLQWTRQFVSECAHDESPEESAELIRRYLENRQIFIWEDRHRPVAMAGFSGQTPNGTRINMVYTEPSARGHGYARGLVLALSRKLLAPTAGKKFSSLFVDSKNTAALRLYKKIGYQHSADFREWTLT